MKKTNYICLAAIMFLMINNTNLNNTTALEEETSTELNFEQSTNNFELIGGMATTNTYSYYSQPTLNSELLNHDLTRINIENLQRYTSLNTDLTTNSSQTNESIATTNVTEYTCSAPFDTLYQLNLNTTTNNYVNYSSAYDLNVGDLTSGTLSNLQADDTNYMKIDSTEFNYFATSISDNTASNILDAGFNVQTTPDNSFVSDDQILRLVDAYQLYTTLSFGMNAIGNDIYKIIVEIRFFTTGTDSLNKIRVKDSTGAISYDEFICPNEDWNTLTLNFQSNGISEISFIKYQTDYAVNIQLDYLYVEKYQKSTIDIDFYSNMFDSVQNLDTNVILNLQINSTIDYQFSINSISQIGTAGLFSNYSFSINTNDTINLSIISVENTYTHFDISIDFLYIYFTPNPVRNVTLKNFEYEINSITYFQNITLNLDTYTGNHTHMFLVYSFDSSILSEYDHINDLFIANSTLNFTVDLISPLMFNISYSLGYSTSEWIVPSETNLRCNNFAVYDESYKSGYISFINYPTSLNFTANDNIIFNFSILSSFSYEFDLDVISTTYLSKTLTLSNYHSIILTSCEYLFEADIKHSYLNNIDYSSLKQLFPSLTLPAASSLKIEVILDDSVYLELDKMNRFANSSSILTVFSRSTGNIPNIGTTDIVFNLPMTMQLEQMQLTISNIRYIQNYLHSEFDRYTTFSESQSQIDSTESYSSNRDSYNHTENTTSNDYFEYQANPNHSRFQTSNRDSYEHTEDSTSLDVFESQIIPEISQFTTTNFENKANYTLYTSNTSEIESIDITPAGFVDSTNIFEQKFTLPDDLKFANISSSNVNLTVANTTETWTETSMTAYKNAEYTWDSILETPEFTYSNQFITEEIITDSSFHRNINQISPNSYGKLTISKNLPTTFEASWFCQIPYFDSGSVKFLFEDGGTNHMITFDNGMEDDGNIQLSSRGQTTSRTDFDYFDKWMHIRFVVNTTHMSLYLDSVLITSDAISNPFEIQTFKIELNKDIFIDSLDFSTSSGYYPYRNTKEIKIVDDNHGHFQGIESFETHTINTQPDCILDQSFSYVVESYQNHDYVLKLNGTATFTPPSAGYFEFWLNSNESISLSLDGTSTLIPSTSNLWTHYRYTYTSLIAITGTCYLDAIDYSSTNYYINRNTELNHTQAIYDLIRFTNSANRTGWYQGAESFDSNTLHTKPSLTTSYASGVSANCYINASYLDHKRILQLNRLSGTGYALFYKTGQFGTQSGTIEFWAAIPDYANQSIVTVYPIGSPYSGPCAIVIYNNRTFFNGFSTNYAESVWQHYRITATFNTTHLITILYLNGIYISTNIAVSAATSLDYFRFQIDSANPIQQTAFFDAFDYSSSPNFFVNRNTLLNYSTALNPILENSNYNHSRHFQGTYSFDSDIVNTKPTRFDIPSGIAYITNEQQNHKKILQMNGTNSPKTYAIQYFNPQTSGTIEFWFNYNNMSVNFLIHLNNLFLFYISNLGLIRAFIPNDTSTGISISANTWTHFRIYFDANSDNWSLYVNSNIVVNNQALQSAITSITYIQFRTQLYDIAYLDALDYSWSSGYFINRNMLENQSTSLENWNAYPSWNSGYKQTNYTIFSNTFVSNSSNLIINEHATKHGMNDWVNYTNPQTGANSFINYNVGGTNQFEFMYTINRNVVYLYTHNNTHYLYRAAIAKTYFNVLNTTGSVLYSIPTVEAPQHLRLLMNSTGISFFINGTFYYHYVFEYPRAYPTYMQCVVAFDSSFMLTGFNTAQQSNYFVNMGMLENTTALMLPMNYSSASLVDLNYTTLSLKNFLYDGSYHYQYELYNETITDTFTFTVIENFTQSPYLNVISQKRVNVGENATFMLSVEKSLFDINLVKVYDSISGINSTIATTGGTFNYVIFSNISRSFNVTFYVEDTGGYYRSISIENCYFAKNQTFLNIDYAKMLYQRAEFNITTTLTQSIYNLNENRSMSISYPNSTIFAQTNNSINSKINYQTGWYAVNISYPGSDQYLASSILRVFEVISTPTPSISISYSERMNVGQANLFNITLTKTLYDLNIGNFTFGSSNYLENLDSTTDTKYYSILYNATTIYDAILYVNDSEGFWTQINLYNLFVAKNQTYLNIDYAKMLYQRAEFNITTILTQSIYNLNENRSLKISYPNSTLFSQTNNSINSKINYQTGWYAVNVSYPGSDQFLSCSILKVFEVISAPTPSISISYSERVNVGEANPFNISVRSTLYALDSGNFTFDSSNYLENLGPVSDNVAYSIIKTESCYYDAIIYVNDSEGFWSQIEISNVFVAKNGSVFTFENLYRSYYQNSTVNVSTSLDRNVTIRIYSIYDVLLQSSVNQSVFSIGWNASGYYRITAEFNDTSNKYLNYSIETYFEVLPLSRAIELSQTVHLSVNSTAITNNVITLNNLNSSFILSFVADELTTFDLSIVYLMNYTTTVNMLSTEFAEFQFLANSNISTIDITNMTLENYPDPFANFLVDGSISENYTISDNIMVMTDAINRTLLNNDLISYGFEMFGEISKFQLDSSISTKDSSVNFREFGIANRTFNNWYIDCSDVVSASITQLRTDIEPSLTNSSDSYYFSTSTIANDIFQIDWSLDPSWMTSSQILENNGTFIRVQVEVQSNFDLQNVTVYFTNPIYFSNWTNATQDYYSKEVHFFADRIDSGTNTFILEASRNVPYADLWYFGSQVNVFMYPNSTQTPAYYAYLSYPEYSEVWEIIPEPNWILDGVHYMNRSYTLANNTFFCEGFDSSITSSFMYFAANPLNSFDVIVNETESTITLSIDLNLPLNQTVLMFPVAIEGNYKIKTKGVTELYDLDGYTWFMIDDPVTLGPGVTTIIISYEVYSLKNSWWYAIPIIAIMFGGLWWYLEKMKNEKKAIAKSKPKMDFKTRDEK